MFLELLGLRGVSDRQGTVLERRTFGDDVGVADQVQLLPLRSLFEFMAGRSLRPVIGHGGNPEKQVRAARQRQDHVEHLDRAPDIDAHDPSWRPQAHRTSNQADPGACSLRCCRHRESAESLRPIADVPHSIEA